MFELHVVVAGVVIFNILELIMKTMPNYPTVDDTKKGANSLGLQMLSVVARVNFPHEETRSLYRTLGEQ
jgi:hypothetical protein